MAVPCLLVLLGLCQNQAAERQVTAWQAVVATPRGLCIVFGMGLRPCMPEAVCKALKVKML